MIQKRKDKRFKQWSRTVIGAAPNGPNSHGSSEVNAFTYDLSLGGARLHSKARFEVGAVLRLQIELVRSREILSIDGRVMWVKTNDTDDVYEMGVEFLHTTAQTVTSLMKNLHDMRL
jgi:c-di-GMP-binding flagellar brake protein YcgR